MSLGSQMAWAADHRDGAAVQIDPSTDINDVYAWMADATHMNLIMTVFPAADANSKFSDKAQYVFNVVSRGSYTSANGAIPTKIVCKFDTAQNVSCYVGLPGTAAKDSVSGNASAAAGITNASGKIKIHTGLHKDPFFFNLDGFNKVASNVAGLTNVSTNANGCPTNLSATTLSAQVAQLGTAVGGGTAVDFFATLKTLAIVIQIDKSLLNAGGSIVSVYGSTHQ